MIDPDYLAKIRRNAVANRENYGVSFWSNRTMCDLLDYIEVIETELLLLRSQFDEQEGKRQPERKQVKART